MKKYFLIILLLSAAFPVAEVRANATISATAGSEGEFNRHGVTLHYRLLGKGSPILFLSGGPGFTVDPLVSMAQEFAKSHTCILFDQRGTGKSKVPMLDSTTINLKAYLDDLEALRTHLKVKRWTIIGLSWGGMLAMSYAATHPEAVSALVLVDSGGINLDFQKDFAANVFKRLLPAEREAAAFWGDPSRIAADPERASFEYLRALAPGYFYDRQKAIPFIRSLTPQTFNIKVNILMMTDLQKEKYDLREALKTFRRPVLLVYGRQDPMGEETAYLIHRSLLHSTLEFIEECGHIPMVEQPRAFFSIVKRFLRAVS